MADAIVRVNTEGTLQPIAPVWSLTIEADEHGPDTATFVCKRLLPKWAETEILVDGFVVADGWVHHCAALEDGENLYVVTVWCWQRELDMDLYTRAYLVAGFERALDARSGPGVNLAYWARAGLVLDDRSVTMGLQPNTIFYAQQGSGVIYDLGEGGVGPLKVWLHQQQMSLPAKAGLYMVVRAHSTRANHHPYVTGEFTEATEGLTTVSGSDGPLWREYTFVGNAHRYVSVFLYTTTTYDMAKDEVEYFIRFDDIRISTVGPGGGGGASVNGSGITSDMAIPDMMLTAPHLTLGTNPVSTLDMYGLATDGFQTPRQMLDRVNVDYWRYRVNPGRVLNRGAYPALPSLTIKREARASLAIPETQTKCFVSYVDLQGDARSVSATVAGAPRLSTQNITLGSADATQATAIANAFLADQSQRRIEGTVVVAPGQVIDRPSGAPRHPSELLLAGGDRAYVDEADDDARIVAVTYDHNSETATVSLSDPVEGLDRAMDTLAGPRYE